MFYLLNRITLWSISACISDVQYIEDYLQNKRDKLVKMAQAYSDYGVLEGKKEGKEGKNDAGKIENRSKMSTRKRSVMEGKYTFLRPNWELDVHPQRQVDLNLHSYVHVLGSMNN